MGTSQNHKNFAETKGKDRAQNGLIPAYHSFVQGRNDDLVHLSKRSQGQQFAYVTFKLANSQCSAVTCSKSTKSVAIELVVAAPTTAARSSPPWRRKVVLAREQQRANCIVTETGDSPLPTFLEHHTLHRTALLGS
mmetsp:Transcript_39665/g.119147  ORF Transcript_39665/g.119147 Transcript_39665/m.119147 type:complete len:136 (-) Transcript_39665:2644-3051(-)